jgi:hypothetical protein
VCGEEILGVHRQLIDKPMNKIPQTGQTASRRNTKVECSGHVAKCHSKKQEATQSTASKKTT